ncbi:MAG: hypothetical protein JXB07_09575 [Anaerolineae bacterium]|nr:hypothetical protein [Anaerolineae bacterium]
MVKSNVNKSPMKSSRPNHDETRGKKKPYTQPKLESYGHLHNVTLGSSSGIGESGNREFVP